MEKDPNDLASDQLQQMLVSLEELLPSATSDIVLMFQRLVCFFLHLL